MNWGKGISFRKAVVLEIVLLRRKVELMGKTFSSSFVRDCRLVFQSEHKFIFSQYASEWRIVFYIAGMIYIFGAIVYCILSTGEKQSWAEVEYSSLLDETDEDSQEEVIMER